MNDVELTRALERGELPNEEFHHHSHLHVAWVYLNESSSAAEAATKMSETLHKVTVASGKPEKYHETITRFWIYLLAHAYAAGGKNLDEIVHQQPRLLEKDFPLAYYSRELLFSERARRSWVEPDLKPICLDALSICSSSSPGDTQDRPLSR